MKKLLLSFLLICGISTVYAQFSLPYQFKGNPDFSKLVAKYDVSKVEEIDVLDEQTIEVAYDKEGNLFEYFYYHQVSYVNSDKAIDRNNKIYISLQKATELVAYDVRVILSNGAIKIVGEGALKEGETEDKSKLQYFAVSGVEKGSYIEYYYLIKRRANTSGSYINFQGSNPKASVKFKIIAPQNLYFGFHLQNKFPEMLRDTSMEDKNIWYAEVNNVPETYDESFANKAANTMRVIYQLSYNSATGKRNPYNYGIVSQTIFENIANSLTKDEQKAIKKIFGNIDFKKATTDEAKIRTLENYIKSNFNYDEANDPRLEDVASILKIKSLNETGAIKVFYNLIEELGIEQEIVVTSNRYKIPFDKEYESYIYLTDYLIYLPKLKLYLAPFTQLYRLGLTPSWNLNNYGLFIRKVSIGELKTGAGKIKFIAENIPNTTKNSMFIEAKLDQTTDSLLIDYKQEYTGYYAQNYQPLYDYIEKDKIAEFEQSIIKGLNQNLTIKSIKVENKGAENLMINPLIFTSKVSSSHFVEKAGSKILIRFGDLIGPQSELYQEKKRLFPVENDFNREYHRKISFIVPDGYVIKNANELNLNIQPFLKTNNGAGFTASYTMAGNTLTLTSFEYYNQVNLPIEEYENYRAVINAAANFNKIVLILEKR